MALLNTRSTNKHTHSGRPAGEQISALPEASNPSPPLQVATPRRRRGRAVKDFRGLLNPSGQAGVDLPRASPPRSDVTGVASARLPTSQIPENKEADLFLCVLKASVSPEGLPDTCSRRAHKTSPRGPRCHILFSRSVYIIQRSALQPPRLLLLDLAALLLLLLFGGQPAGPGSLTPGGVGDRQNRSRQGPGVGGGVG